MIEGMPIEDALEQARLDEELLLEQMDRISRHLYDTQRLIKILDHEKEMEEAE